MPRWDDLERDLVHRGASPRYARRLRDELADHHAALVEESRSGGAGSVEAQRVADGALGDLAAVATRALTSRRSRSLANTRPALVFVVGPLATALATLSVAIGTAAGLAWAGLELFGLAEDGRALRHFANASYALIAFAALPALAFLFCAQAWLGRASMRWALVACVLLATLGGVLVLGYHIPSPAAPGGEIHAGRGWEVRAWRFALPLLTFLAFGALVRHERGAALVRSLHRFAL